MPIDPSIILGAVGQRRESQSPLSMLGDLMNLKRGAQQIQENNLDIKAKQSVQDDDNAMRTVLQKRTPINPQTGEPGAPDLDQVIYDLHAMGKGSAALRLQDKVFEWAGKKAVDMGNTATANKTRIETAGRMAQSIMSSPDPEQAFKLVKPQVAKLVGDDLAAALGDRYDPIRVKQVLDQGTDVSEMLTRQKNAFDQANKLLEDQRNWLKDGNEWSAKQPEIQNRWTNIGSGYLSLSQNQQDWEQGLQMVKQGMSTLPKATVDAVMGQFEPQFSPAAREKARLLGMTQNERSNERQENARLSDARQARAGQDDTKLTPDAVEMLAQQFARNGQLPAMGMGTNATKNRDQIYNRAATVFQGLDLATQAAAFKSYQASLQRLQPMLNAVNAFEETAIKNTRSFLQSAQKVVDTGSPILNQPLRTVSRQVLGSPQLATMETLRQPVISEFARILGSPTLASQLTDAARTEMDKVMKSDYSYGQLFNAAKALFGDAENRRTSYQDEIDGIKRLMSAAPSYALPGQTVTDGSKPAGGIPANYKGVVKQDGVDHYIETDSTGKLVVNRPGTR